MSITFKHVFIAVVIATALIVAALLINRARPPVETQQPSADLISAAGKCASCHRRETAAVVHQYEASRHARVGVTCLDCHRPADGQDGAAHNGYEITSSLTAKNCARCHATEYEQFRRSRHAAPAWAAVAGREAFTEEQLAEGELHHPGAVNRPANALAALEGQAAITRGCAACHEVGRPNTDGSIGSCTHCHSRHRASIALARSPQTCGQCHMGPDHSQIEIYNESKHGALFAAQRAEMNLSVDPDELTTRHMPIPTCATCHMSGLEGLKVTHDVGERLSWFLFAPISEKRRNYQSGQQEMKEVCLKCHAAPHVERFYNEAEAVLLATNDKVAEAQALVSQLRAEGLLTPAPFDEVIEFVDFDLWHYYGRTAKHGAFMGGADFVQWHGNYELLLKKVELEEQAAELRSRRGE